MTDFRSAPEQSLSRNRHWLGVISMAVSASVFSTAGLFTKGVAADAWTVIFWRGVFAAAFTFAYIVVKGRIRPEIVEMGRSGISVTILATLGTIAFIPAFKLTTIANVALIYAAAPFCAAGLAWIWFGERIERRTAIAAAIAMVGVGLIVWDSLGQLHLRGDLLALWMTLMMASMMVVYRRFPNTPASGPAMMSSIALVIAAMPFCNPFDVDMRDFGTLAAFGLVFAIASVTLSEGARRLPPVEAALISALETPLAILLAACVFSEIPGIFPTIGGLIVMLAVVASQVLRPHPRTETTT